MCKIQAVAFCLCVELYLFCIFCMQRERKETGWGCCCCFTIIFLNIMFISLKICNMSIHNSGPKCICSDFKAGRFPAATQESQGYLVGWSWLGGSANRLLFIGCLLMSVHGNEKANEVVQAAASYILLSCSFSYRYLYPNVWPAISSVQYTR